MSAGTSLDAAGADRLLAALGEQLALRALRRSYGEALTVLFASRTDQIHFKLYAAVDQGAGRHFADLQALEPTEPELLKAARWSRTHDPSEGYRSVLRARHFFKTLSAVAESPLVQVCYATHSPYFVSSERFDSLRLFRRQHTEEGGRGATVTAAILDVVANDLPDTERANARPYLARTLSEQFRETFFAKSVLLTEGPSDAAVLETAAELLGLGSLAADGVVITNVGGKGSQPVALAILDALGIPTFCVFEGDGDSRDGDACETCGRAKRDRTATAASNRKILASLGGPEIDFPPNTVEARWACFETEIEDVIEGFRKILSEVQNEMSWKRKAPVAYAETVRRLGVQALPPEIIEILMRTRGLAGLDG